MVVLGIFPIIIVYILVFFSFSIILFYMLNSALFLQCNRMMTADRDRNSFNISYHGISTRDIGSPTHCIPSEVNYYLMFV
jgi:hypothetical protein